MYQESEIVVAAGTITKRQPELRYRIITYARYEVWFATVNSMSGFLVCKSTRNAALESIRILLLSMLRDAFTKTEANIRCKNTI